MSDGGTTEQNVRIEALDREIIGLVEKRLRLARSLDSTHRVDGTLPGPASLTTYLARFGADIEASEVPAATLRAVLREIWSGDVAIHQSGRIAFLGPMATYTHEAAMASFGAGMEYVEQPTIADVFDAVSRGDAAYGVVPVENTTEGCVSHTLDMFVDSDLKICAELNLPIHHCLLAPCAREEIKVLYSHSQVFGQCRCWLQKTLPRVRLVEVSSTTEAASRCTREACAGALASALAAERYALPVLEANIEDFTENTTRFLVLGQHAPKRTSEDKTSILMAIRHRVGALYDSLLPFGRHGVNLTFIESRPSKRRNWEYYFFIDFIGHMDEERVREVLDELAEHCQFIKILGSYPRAAGNP